MNGILLHDKATRHARAMARGRLVWLLAALVVLPCLPLRAQKSATAQSMEAQGMVDIATLDSTIRVRLLYSLW